MKLLNKIAIITGAASGIGRSIAFAYAQEGAKVIIADINYEEAKNICDKIEKIGSKALALKVDVTNEADITNLVNSALDKFGTIDILVNNAGIMDNMAGAGDISDETWYRVLETNTTSVMRMIRKVLPTFIMKRSGVIINIASVGGIKGCIAGVAYTASKHALYWYN